MEYRSTPKAAGALGRKKKGSSRNVIKTALQKGDDAVSSQNGQYNRRGMNLNPDRIVHDVDKPHFSRALHKKRVRRYVSDRAYAALDLGTNNCRLLIVRPTFGGFCVQDSYSRIVRLGEGLTVTGHLNDQAINRAIEALRVCAQKLRHHNIVKARLIATEACRQAENSVQFIDKVKQKTGLDLEIINRRTEARLAVSGCSTLVDPKADGVVLFDIGGGSTELVFLDFRSGRPYFHAQMHRYIRAWTSLKVGVITLSERFDGVEITPDIYQKMVTYVKDMLAHFNAKDLIHKAIASSNVHFLGTSGTITTLAGVYLNLPRYDRRRIDGCWLNAQDVDTMIRKTCSMNYQQRIENPCIGTDRADLVLAGCAILDALRQTWYCPRMRVADRGLREGLLVEMMASDGVWRKRYHHKKHCPKRYRS